MASKLELYKDSSGGFRFRLKAANGAVIATSESYTSKSSAQNATDSVTSDAGTPVVDLV